MEVKRTSGSSTWNEFVRANSGLFFNSYEWGEVSRLYNHTPYYFTVVDGNEICGVLPLVHMDSRLFGETLISMPYCEHGSVIVDSSDTRADRARKQLYDRALETADQLSVDYLCLRGTRHRGSSAFFRFTRYVNFEIKTSESRDALWDSFETRFRNNVRMAQEKDFETEIVRSPPDGRATDTIDSYYDLHLRTMRHLGSPPHSRRFFEELHRRLGDNVLFCFAFRNEVLTNAALVFGFNGTLHYWGAVSDPEYRELNGGSLLLWRCLQWACENGYDRFELGRARPNSGVYRFKSSLSGSKVWLDDLYYFPGGFVAPPDPDDSKYQPLIRAWRRLPLSITRSVGPYLRGNIP